MNAEELSKSGYRRTSRKFGLVSRIDRADWKEFLRGQRINVDAPVHWEDYYRRCHSKDTLEIPPSIALKIPASQDQEKECGYVERGEVKNG